MGQEIAYCAICGNRLRSADFDKGQAFRHQNLTYCKTCAPEDVRSASLAPPSKSSPAIMPRGSSHQVSIVPPEPKSFPLGILIAVIIVVLLAAAVMLTSRSAPEPPPIVAPKPPAPPPIVKVDPPPPPTTPQPPPSEEAARKLKERIAADLVALDQELQPFLAREDFQNALGRLGSARGRHPGTDWSQPIDERERRVSSDIDKLYAGLQTDAMEARKTGDENKVREIAARVAKWELPGYVKTLEGVLAGTSKPPPPVDPEVAGYRTAWEAAFSLAADRDPAGLKTLEDAGRVLRTPALKAEADADLKLFRQASAAVEEGLRLLAATPKGETLSLRVHSESGNPRNVTGVVKRIDKYKVELDPDVVHFGEVLAGSLMGLVRDRSPRKAEFDPAALELASLLDNREDAKPPGVGPALPGKYWEYVPQFHPDRSRREAEARKLFYQAERDAAGFETSVDAARAYKSILADFAATAFVRRNQAWIASRSDLGKDYVFLPADLKVSAGFKPASSDKVKSFWKSSAAGDNSVELAFSTLPGTEYRAWVYVGGCCLESLTFSSDDVPVKQTLATTPKTHGDHGAKTNVRWGWVALPKVASKKIRLVARGDAFSIAYAVVSATRQAPPKDNEIAEIEKLRPDAAARAAAKPPAEIIVTTDFSTEGAIWPNFEIHRGDFPLKVSGLAEISFAPSQGGADRTWFRTYSQYAPPFRLVADLEFTRRDPKAILAIRFQNFGSGDMVDSLTATSHAKYDLSLRSGTGKVCDAGPAGQRELWTIDIADETAVWSVNGKEILRMPGVQMNLGYQIFLSIAGAEGIDPETKVRIRNLTLEKLKR